MAKKRSKKQRSRIYWREQGGERRAYGDFRDVGGGREALIPQGEKLATTDPLIAEHLAGVRLRELQEQKRNKHILGIERQAGLKQFVAHHLVQKAKAARVTESWLAETQRRLDVAIEFFGEDKDIASITVSDVQGFTNGLAVRSGGRKGNRTLSGQSVRHYLNALSNLYRRAQAEGYVQPGYNPVAAMLDKPTAKREEARWLEIHDATLLLESARLYQHPIDRRPTIPFMYPMLATFLLTGGRQSEVLGLQVEDVSFDRRTVTFRPNQFRRLKTKTSHRSVPMHPQLEEALREYMFGGDTPRVSGLLFPSVRTKKPSMTVDLRKALDAIAERAGWAAGDIRSKAFRHTYCAARLQTLDRGAPVSIFTVSREMGHGGDSLVRRVYGHLGEVRHRSEVVEYRPDQQLAQLEAEAAAAEANPARLVEAERLRANCYAYRERLRSLRAVASTSEGFSAKNSDRRVVANQRQPSGVPVENQQLTREPSAD